MEIVDSYLKVDIKFLFTGNHSDPNSKPVFITPMMRQDHSIPSGKPYLPVDLVSEILSWLSVECLARCKSVCKQWLELIQDRYFIQKHMSRSKNLNCYTNPCQENGVSYEWIIIFDGLIMERCIVLNKYRIRNLAMRRTIDLPAPTHNSRDFFVTLLICGCYKLVSVYDYREETKYSKGFEVLTLGKDEKPSWRALDTHIFRDFNGQEHRPIIVISAVAYFVRTNTVGSEDYEIVSLDMENESFTVFYLARSSFPESNKVFPMCWDFHFALSVIANNELHVLVLRDYKKGKWNKKTVIPLKFYKKNPDKFGNNVVPRRWIADKSVILFRVIKGHISDFAYSTVSEEVVCEHTKNRRRTFPFGQSLVTFKGMRPE